MGEGANTVLLACLLAYAALPLESRGSDETRHVVLISVDGLRSSALADDALRTLPNFRRLTTEGAATLNARADYDYTVTLPNHIVQLTGRGIVGAAGHDWTSNRDPADGATLHTNRGGYVASVFDAVHDAGLTTAAFASKSKFSLFDVSYDGDGRFETSDKIDRFLYERDTGLLVSTLVAEMRVSRYAFVFLHLRDPDSAGHAYGWESEAYSAALARVDALLGRVIALAESPAFAGATTLILTSDHGGSGRGHGNAAIPEDYTVPFLVWGAGVSTGTDLYALNRMTRLDPGTSRPSYDALPQPIRNGDAANLATSLLGVPDVPGSTINKIARLTVAPRVERLRGIIARCADVVGATSRYDQTFGRYACDATDGANRPSDERGAGEEDSTEAEAGFPTEVPGVVAPDEIMLGQNYPNPFSQTTLIPVRVRREGPVRLDIYDVRGKRVTTLTAGSTGPGVYAIGWNARDEKAQPVPSGAYIYRIAGRRGSRGRLMTLVR